MNSWYYGFFRWPIPEPPIYEIKYLCPTAWRGRVSFSTMRDAPVSFPAQASPVGILKDRRYIS